MREIANTWAGTAWFIEADIADCFGSLDHDRLVEILSNRIHDNRFLRLVRNMLTAGYLEDWKWGATQSGVPQGGIASPVLSNIYLHKLDVFVEPEGGGDPVFVMTLDPGYEAVQPTPVGRNWRFAQSDVWMGGFVPTVEPEQLVQFTGPQ